ncbi:hypothetical protein AMTR_s00081p00120780 [Amborella trichopoda]|uniref:Uncharacterized protein n=1 Tax=Amborella trichopoda TaxID=13333 RepID=W1PA74_AMBTC|nr:hypothetical protein AMTR_s00081p00120780 [Amborella trichopoda]
MGDILDEKVEYLKELVVMVMHKRHLHRHGPAKIRPMGMAPTRMALFSDQHDSENETIFDGSISRSDHNEGHGAQDLDIGASQMMIRVGCSVRFR